LVNIFEFVNAALRGGELERGRGGEGEKGEGIKTKE